MSIFRVVGNPGAAVQATLTAGQVIRVAYGAVSVSKHALKIERGHYASLAGPAELVLSPAHSPSIIQLTQKWTVNPRNLVAWDGKLVSNTIEGPGEMVLSGRGGVCQVDVGEGEKLVIEADKLVAYTGPAGSTIFRESRFDVAGAWVSWAWQGTKDTSRWLARQTRALASRVSWLVAKLGPPNPEKAPQPVEKATKTFEIPEGLERALASARSATDVVAAKTFEYTHPPKLSFEGPCSVVIAAE